MPNVKDLLDVCVHQDASDLHLTVGRPPVLRRHGRLVDTGGAPLSPEDTEAMIREVAPERSIKEAEEVGSSDFALAHKQGARFRVNIYRQKSHWGMAMRLIPRELLSFEDIGRV